VRTELAGAGCGLDHDAITKLAAAEAPGCGGLNYLPYLRGERTPNWPGASGALIGMRHGMLGRPGLIYRAAVEGVTYSLLSGVGQMKRFGVSDLKELRVVGGGSKNPLWCDVIAGSFGVPLKFPAETETAALGAGLQAAGVHHGVEDLAAFVADKAPSQNREILPNLDHSALYGEAFARHEQLGRSLFA